MRKVSRKTTQRALLYIRILEGLIKEKRHLVSSRQLAQMVGVTDVQIRKDISHFGKVGTPRVGYNTADLKRTLEDFVLEKNIVRAVLFGVGNLGSAVLHYPGFHKEKIKIVAAFDKSGQKIGKKFNGVATFSIKRAPEIIQKLKVDLGIIAVPKEAAQEVADLMVLSGLRGIINFAPVSLAVPKNVVVKDIDLTIEFLSLFCDIKH